MHNVLLYMVLGAGMAAGDPTAVGTGQSQPQPRPLQLMLHLQGPGSDAPAEQRQQRLDRLAAGFGTNPAVRLQWLRPLAVGGGVVRVHGLSEARHAPFVQWLSEQPGVINVEVDGRMQIGPGPRLPHADMQRD